MLKLLKNRNTFTPEEVRQRLRQDPEHARDARTMAVLAAAAQTSVWSSLLPADQAFTLGRTGTRLPTVVYWYTQGVSPHEIGRRLSAFGSAWDAERALQVASRLIAQALNRHSSADLAA